MRCFLISLQMVVLSLPAFLPRLATSLSPWSMASLMILLADCVMCDMIGKRGMENATVNVSLQDKTHKAAPPPPCAFCPPDENISQKSTKAFCKTKCTNPSSVKVNARKKRIYVHLPFQSTKCEKTQNWFVIFMNRYIMPQKNY